MKYSERFTRACEKLTLSKAPGTILVFTHEHAHSKHLHIDFSFFLSFFHFLSLSLDSCIPFFLSYPLFLCFIRFLSLSLSLSLSLYSHEQNDTNNHAISTPTTSSSDNTIVFNRLLHT